jgi:hypothetical protein
MRSEWNRREWVAALAGTGAALAQTESLPQTPEQELALARKRVLGNLEALDKFKLPPGTEPAFRFEA